MLFTDNSAHQSFDGNEPSPNNPAANEADCERFWPRPEIVRLLKKTGSLPTLEDSLENPS